MLRFFRRRRKIVATADVYGRPDLIAVLYKGDSYYVYMPRCFLDCYAAK